MSLMQQEVTERVVYLGEFLKQLALWSGSWSGAWLFNEKPEEKISQYRPFNTYIQYIFNFITFWSRNLEGYVIMESLRELFSNRNPSTNINFTQVFLF
jgi:hypothetical protein